MNGGDDGTRTRGLCRDSSRSLLENSARAASDYRVARQPCGRLALSELGVKVSLHPAQALRTYICILCARSVVRASGQAATSGRGLHGAIYPRLRAVLPISCGRSPRARSTWEEAEKVQSDLGTDEDQAR
jgi:hypothetical protein